MTLPELAFISLGSNVEPEANLPRAARRLAEIGAIRRVSMVYQNPAIGPSAAPDFLNAAVLIETDLPPEEIRRRLRQIEMEMGRVRTADKYTPRTIDLDLVLLGSQVISGPEITLPDPDILSRPHLAVTIAELAPEFPHPVTGEPLSAIAERLRPQAILTARPDVATALSKGTEGRSN
jgi:2-amino-4-hydroxy-6-hydroxymethyldihydropteridine diphosphokinase